MLRRFVLSLAALGFISGAPAADQSGGDSYPITNPDGGGQVVDSDRTFVLKAASGGMFEVKSSELALKKGVEGDLRTFATMMVEDHQAANQQLEKIAGRKSIDIPKELNGEHRQLLDQL